MMANPENRGSTEGTICEICRKPINRHLPEELERCEKVRKLKRDCGI